MERPNHYSLLHLVIIGLLILLSVEGYASEKIDSLKQAIILSDDISKRAATSLELGLEYYHAMEEDSAMHYYNYAFDLATSSGNKEVMAEAVYKQSLLFNRLGDYKSALERVETYIDLTGSLGDTAKIAKGYYHFGNVVIESGQIDTAIRCYRKSLEMYTMIDHDLGIVASHNAIGNSFKNLAMYDSAAYYFLEAARKAEKAGMEHLLGSILYNLGTIHTSLGQYEQAKQYTLSALRISQEYNMVSYESLCYVHLGNIANDLKEQDTALMYYQKADSLLRILGDLHGIANITNGLGELYEKQGKYDMAMQKYEEAIVYYRKQDQALGLAISLRNIADIYSWKKNYPMAKTYYDSAMWIAEKAGYIRTKKDILRDISVDYYSSGRYEEAYNYQTEYYELADSIFNLEKARVIEDLKFQYEKEKDLARILKLRNENLEKENIIQKRRSQQRITLYTGIAMVIIVLLIAMYLRQKAVKDKAIAEQKIKRLEEEKKVLAAKALVEGQEEERKRLARELHDGLGVLLSTTRMQFSTIVDRSPESRHLIEKAEKLLEQASSDVRRISHNMMPGLLTRLGLYEAVEDLVENLRETQGLAVEAQVPLEAERLPENKEIMVYRVIQELINNTLKHARAKRIILTIKVSENSLDIDYSDDGIGFDAERLQDTGSVGLKSISSRINFLKGSLKLVTSPGKGTNCTISVPV